jgi:K+-transporting ATPase ATPase C chain
MFVRSIRPAASLLVIMTALLGLAYPLLVTGIARVVFRSQAAGSLVYRDGKLVGSSLVGQHFSDPAHFWGRPSATTPQPYNGMGSTGSNLGPLNPALIDAVKANAKALRDADPDSRAPVPVDLVTASASGLDPEISLAGARFQAPRVARARGVEMAKVLALIEAHSEDRLFGFFGEPRVNVLALNLAIDQLYPAAQPEKEPTPPGH